MAAQNFYIGVKRGAVRQMTLDTIVAGTSSAGTAVDVEVRMQINDGSTATGLTRKDTLVALDILEAFIQHGGNNHDGQNIPSI